MKAEPSSEWRRRHDWWDDTLMMVLYWLTFFAIILMVLVGNVFQVLTGAETVQEAVGDVVEMMFYTLLPVLVVGIIIWLKERPI